MKRRRRVLHKLKITEISAVDKPAQEGARMAIMKRADDAPSFTDLEDRILVLQDRIDVALLKYSPGQARDDHGRFASGGGSGSSPSPSEPPSERGSLDAASKLPDAPQAAPPNRRAWLKSALKNSLRGAVLSSAPARRAVMRATATLVNAVAPSAPFVRDTVALAAVGGVKVAGVIADVKAMLHFVRGVRAQEITKAASGDTIIDSIDRALAALAAYERSRAPSQRTTTEPPMDSFERAALEIQKRDGCSRTDGLRKARQEHPDAYADFNAEPLRKSSLGFDALVEMEIRKGFPAAVAAQRVVTVHGVRPPKREAAR